MGPAREVSCSIQVAFVLAIDMYSTKWWLHYHSVDKHNDYHNALSITQNNEDM